MTTDKRIIDPLTEWVIEEGWRISRLFIRELEQEFNCGDKVSLNLIIPSQYLAIRWLSFAMRN